MSWHYPKRGKKSEAKGLPLRRLPDDTATWGGMWMEAVQRFTSAAQLARGLRYAKAGQVLSIKIEGGFATAEVQGTRARPYTVELGLAMFATKRWMRVADAMVKRAFFTAKLLAGEMPPEMEAIFKASGAPLLPASREDLFADCSCTEPASPCKHAAAAFYMFAQEIDRDPFVLLEMRGLGRAALLAEIQARRAVGAIAATPPAVPAADRAAQTYLSPHLNVFFQAPNPDALVWPAEPDDSGRRVQPGSRVREMGAPPFWQSDNDFEDVLTRIYLAVRKRALG